MSDTQTIREQVSAAAAGHTALAIEGGGSKRFLGRGVAGQPLPVGAHRGIIDYTPSELVISARAGTPLAELEATLAAEGQMLAFEPPHFGAAATLGGTIACGLSGPRRPYAGAARDFVLGVNCINGQGDYLRFGGQVMKNVAGYDLSRTLTGSFGTLAVLLDVHLKVLPRPEREITLLQPCTVAEAITRCNHWAGQPLPLSGACHFDHQLLIRLSGTARGVAAAARTALRYAASVNRFVSPRPTSSTRSAAIPGTPCSSREVPDRPLRSPRASALESAPRAARSAAAAARVSEGAAPPSPWWTPSTRQPVLAVWGPAARMLNSTRISRVMSALSIA